ncbi:MAG: dienelactone hydrolase family protein [Thermomicrobiales bacterium]|nr:dienelactone hydrolase family protein [Thermomicrobiales bacterium]
MKALGPFDRYLIHEFVEDYLDGLMSRRDMIRRVIYITGGVASAATVLTSMGITPMTRAAIAQETTPAASSEPQSPLSVANDDPRVTGSDITITAQDGASIAAYQALPVTMGTPEAGASPVAMNGLPLVLVCHENRGLTEHIRDVTRRWAVEGYAACAIDLLSREGGTASFTDQAAIQGVLSDVDPSRHGNDFIDAFDQHGTVDGVDAARVGMTGFCFGGGITWRVATSMPELKAAAPYYGPPPELSEVPNIRAAVLGVYSDDPDDFANNGRDELEQALTDAGVTFQFNIYPNTQHAFHNDTGQRWNEEASLQAWADTVAWFAEHVS